MIVSNLSEFISISHQFFSDFLYNLTFCQKLTFLRVRSLNSFVHQFVCTCQHLVWAPTCSDKRQQILGVELYKKKEEIHVKSIVHEFPLQLQASSSLRCIFWFHDNSDIPCSWLKTRENSAHKYTYSLKKNYNWS